MPPITVLEVSAIVSGGLMVKTALWLELRYEAVIVAFCADVTDVVVIGNFADACEKGIVRLIGTCAAELLLAS